MRPLRLLFLIVLIFTLQCVPVMAAVGDYDLTKTGEAYTLVYETADPVGTQVVLIMMAGSSLTDGKVPISASGDISYIDQTAVTVGAGTNQVTFNSFIPMDTEEEYHSLYLGGLAAGPVWVATISVSGILVSGTVEYFGADNLTLNLYDSTKTNILKTVTVSKAVQDKTGPFAFSRVEAGTYYLKANKSRCLSGYTVVNIDVADLTITELSYKLYAGDIDSNSAINVYDLSILLKDFGKTSGLLNIGSDIDENAAVNVYDLSALLKNFGMSVL